MIDDKDTRDWLDRRDKALFDFLAEQADRSRRHESRMAKTTFLAVIIATASAVAGALSAVVAVYADFHAAFSSPMSIVTSSPGTPPNTMFPPFSMPVPYDSGAPALVPVEANAISVPAYHAVPVDEKGQSLPSSPPTTYRPRTESTEPAK